MSVFFSHNDAEQRGLVTVLSAPGAPQADVMVIPEWGGYTMFKSLLLGLSVTQGTNHQFRHMVGDDIYLYLFGDRIGNVTLSGISFYGSCVDEGGESKIGLIHVLDFFEQNKLTRRMQPLLITLQPDKVLQCYLTAMRAESQDPADRTFTFQMDLALIPQSN